MTVNHSRIQSQSKEQSGELPTSVVGDKPQAAKRQVDSDKRPATLPSSKLMAQNTEPMTEPADDGQVATIDRMIQAMMARATFGSLVLIVIGPL